MPTQEKQQVITAINDLGRRVTAADVATKTGLPYLTVSAELNKIAAETGGHLQVATTGDIAYKFDLGFQSAYLARGFHKLLIDGARKLFHLGFLLLRVSFGIVLIASLLIIIGTMFFVMLYFNRMNDSNDQGSDSSSSFFDFLLWRELFETLIWWNYDPYAITDSRGYGQYRGRLQQRARKGNFLLNCFSFLFGDGNPNSDLEERRWQNIAALIKANHGCVVAEQLAPYTGNDPINEDGVLPVLVRFDGRPEVTENGNIVYLFPSLQSTASESHAASLPAYLRERTWVFTKCSNEELYPVIGVALANLLGSWWALTLALRPPYLLFHWLALFNALAAYGTLFVAIPIVRYFVISWLNLRIEERNKRNERFAANLNNKLDTPLQLKLREGSSFAQKDSLIGKSEIVYTTEKDELEQEFDRPAGG
jgi:putative flippase GtrA